MGGKPIAVKWLQHKQPLTVPHERFRRKVRSGRQSPPASAMRISREILTNAKAVESSLCGEYLAFAYSTELTVIRTLDQVTVFHVYCRGKITAVGWSPDCDHVLCVVPSRNSVEAFSLSSPQWTCVIQENACGLYSAVWSPSGCHIITVAEHAVRLAIWSLVGRSVSFIETPLMKAKDKLAFSPDGKYLAVTMGIPEEYNISIFSTSSWILLRKISCTNDVNFPSVPLWSANGSYVAIRETIDLRNSLLEVYSISAGEKVGEFRTRPKYGFRGISCVAWSPNSQFLLVGCRDDSIYVLNYLTWGVLGVFTHRKVVEENTQILEETEGGFAILRERPVKFTFIVAQPKRLPGVRKISFAGDGLHVATQTAGLPAVVWLWDLEAFALTTVTAFRYQIADFRWSLSGLSLLVCGRSSRVSVWRSGTMSHLDLQAAGAGARVSLRKAVWLPSRTATFLLFTSSSLYIVSDFE